MTGESVTLSESDLALVEALQVAPRAPWTSVAAALGVSAETAAIRWARLAAAGAAWVSGTPGTMLWHTQRVGYVEVDCVPRHRLAVAHELAHDQHALSVELTVGGADLFVTVAAADLTALSGYLLNRLGRLDGVSDTRASIATRLHRDGSDWRLGALAPHAVTALPASPPAEAAPPSVLSEADRAILTRLGLDGRTSYAELARASGVSEPTARRRVGRLLRTGAVLLRAEVAAPLAGWPVLAVFFLDVPTSGLDQAARVLSRLREVRLCATLAGTHPLVVAAWLHEFEEIHRFESSLARIVPGLAVRSRLATLRPVKRMGRLLDEHGRAVAAIPMDIWRHP